MPSATIKLFLPRGDPKRLRTAEISNWSGKAVAAARTEFDALLDREEMGQSGVYVLAGSDPETGNPMAYVGEAEVLRDVEFSSPSAAAAVVHGGTARTMRETIGLSEPTVQLSVQRTGFAGR